MDRGNIRVNDIIYKRLGTSRIMTAYLPQNILFFVLDKLQIICYWFTEKFLSFILNFNITGFSQLEISYLDFCIVPLLTTTTTPAKLFLEMI